MPITKEIAHEDYGKTECLTREYWRYEFAGRIAAGMNSNAKFDHLQSVRLMKVAVEQADALLAALEADDD